MMMANDVNIDFAKKELKGNQFQRPLEAILSNLGLLKSSLNSKELLNNASKYFKDIEANHEQLKSAFDAVGNDLEFTVEGLKKRSRIDAYIPDYLKRFDEFKNKYSSMSLDDQNKALLGFIANIRMMIAHAGDTSNLILDPDLDSYYLMDVTLLAYPQMTDRVQEIATYIQGIYQSGVLTQQNKIQLSIYAALLKQSDSDRISGDVATVLNEDENFYGRSEGLHTKLDPQVKDLLVEVQSYISLLTSFSEKDVINGEDIAKVNNLTTTILEKSTSSWNTAVAELDILLGKRTDELSSQKYHSLIYSLFALLVAVVILFYISSSFNNNMKKVLVTLNETLISTKDSGEKLVMISNKLSEATNDQAAALQETASAIEEINSMVQSTLNSTVSVDDAARDSLDSSEKNYSAVGKLTDSIEEVSNSNSNIMKTVEKNGEKMNDIANIIKGIESKTKVINDIVFQTKLLSFNASVEAARAGEHGKGFSVVAEEVGNLAQMSGNASKEISTLLVGSVEQVNEISKVTNKEVKVLVEEGKEKVESSILVVRSFSESTQLVLEKIKTLRNNIASISQAAGEQAKGVEEISKAIQQLDTLTQKNSLMSTQTATYSKNLFEQAAVLENIVNNIELEVLGKKSRKLHKIKTELPDVSTKDDSDSSLNKISLAS